MPDGPTTGKIPPSARVNAFQVLIGCGVAGFVLGLVLPFPWPLPWPERVVGLVPLAVGSLMGAPALRAMLRRGTSPVPTRTPTALVTSGVYRITRNPMYLGLLAQYAGLALLCGVGWALLLLPLVGLVIDRRIVPSEERVLEFQFGEEYLHYRSRVRRWV